MLPLELQILFTRLVNLLNILNLLVGFFFCTYLHEFEVVCTLLGRGSSRVVDSTPSLSFFFVDTGKAEVEQIRLTALLYEP